MDSALQIVVYLVHGSGGWESKDLAWASDKGLELNHSRETSEHTAYKHEIRLKSLTSEICFGNNQPTMVMKALLHL